VKVKHEARVGRGSAGTEGRAVVELLDANAGRPKRETSRTFEAVRAEALFVWTLQRSRSPSPDRVRRACRRDVLPRLGGPVAVPRKRPASSATTPTPR
jgi:hypothetical protein